MAANVREAGPGEAPNCLFALTWRPLEEGEWGAEEGAGAGTGAPPAGLIRVPTLFTSRAVRAREELLVIRRYVFKHINVRCVYLYMQRL